MVVAVVASEVDSAAAIVVVASVVIAVVSVADVVVAKAVQVVANAINVERLVTLPANAQAVAVVAEVVVVDSVVATVDETSKFIILSLNDPSHLASSNLISSFFKVASPTDPAQDPVRQTNNFFLQN